jgi:lipoyl(octanoyl) transferase
MIEFLYLGRMDYAEGLVLQAEMAELVTAGRLGNVLLLLEHPAVLTLGRNGNRGNVLASDELLAARGVQLHEINRGGDVTYHGPGQLVGYPIFDLRTLRGPGGGRMGPVDFVRGMEEALIRVCLTYGVRAGRVAGLTGVWVGEQGTGGRDQGAGIRDQRSGTEGLDAAGSERKIGAIGIHVSKGITSHGFAFNVTTDLRDFELIVPCGIADHAVTSLEREMAPQAGIPALEAAAHEAARQFGRVFDQQVLAVDSLAGLRSHARPAQEFPAQEFPAEDTPLRAPPELERLRGAGEGPVRA